MSNEIEANADLILKYLTNLYNNDKATNGARGEDIGEATGLLPYKINQAVEFLKSNGYIESPFGPHFIKPYLFYRVKVSTKGIEGYQKKHNPKRLKLLEELKPVNQETVPIYPEHDTSMTNEELFRRMITHPEISKVSRSHFKNGNYRNAVLDAAIRLEEMVKQKANYPKDNRGKELSGVALMHSVFDSNKPILSWCKNERQIERDELEGYKLIFAGTVLGIRDTKAHAIFEIEPLRALKLLTLITLLAELVDASKNLTIKSEN
jgi:uncharacterized protein (TIGR02391 family)